MNHEEFESLNPEEQAKVFYQCSFQERGELLPYCHAPELFVRSLSPEELYLMTRELDPEERSEIFRYANVIQLVFISDIDCWKKDRLIADGFIDWLKALLEADNERLIRWLDEIDFEAVVAGFKKIIRVIKPEWEYPSDELLEDEPYFTLDDRYFILVKEENLETVKQAVEKIYEHHRGRYAALLEGVLNELDDEIEEEAYRRREVRLAERGFPDPETARHIYFPISKEQFEKFPLKNAFRVQSPEKTDSLPVTHYPILWSQERLFLDEVMRLFQEGPDQVLEGLQEELMWLSNKVIACEGIDFSSEERVRRGVVRARYLVNIGLEELSGCDLIQARNVLTTRWLEIVFRCGVSCLYDLRNEASEILQIYWKGSLEHFLDFLDPPYRAVFEGFLPARNAKSKVSFLLPVFYDESLKNEDHFSRDFRNRQDIEKTHRAVREVKKIHRFLSENFPNIFHLINLERERKEVSYTLFSLSGTVFVRFVLQETSRDGYLSCEDLRRFLERGFRKNDSGKWLNEKDKDGFLSHFFSAEDRDFLRPFWNAVFHRLEDELGRLDSKRKIDPRFVFLPLVES